MMSEGRRNEGWHFTSAVICTLANIHRGPNKAAYNVERFHPYLMKKAKKPTWREFVAVCKGSMKQETVIHGWR